MRLTAFSAQNYLSHRGQNIVIAPETRVLLVAGPNGVGKTAIAQGIKLALRGEPVRGLQYKKDLAQLVTQGEKDGEVIVEALEKIVDGDIAQEFDHEFRVNLRSAAHSGGEIAQSTVSLDPAEFFALAPADRRHLLFSMAGIKLTPAAIKDVLVKKGHDSARVDRIINHLRVSFDAAAVEARTAATEARGAWKAITGETYGEVKANDWKAPKPKEARPEPIDELTRVVREAENALELCESERQELRDAATAWKTAQTSIKAKSQLTANREALSAAEKLREQLAGEVKRLEASAPPARKGRGSPAAFHCPGCGVALAYAPDGEVIEWNEDVPDAGADAARSALLLARENLDTCSSNVARLGFAVDSGQQAEKLLQSLPKQPGDDEMRKADTAVAAARAAVTIAQHELSTGQASMLARTEAADKTRLAAEQHADVIGFTALADAVQNIPAEYLSTTLVQVNYFTTRVSSHAGFDKSVQIGEDMEARYGTVAYGLASESQQWRIHAAVGYALAVMSGFGVLVLDKFDDVEPKARGAILKFFGTRDGGNEHDVQVVLCATLKERPKLPEPPFQVVWLGG